MTSTVTLIGFGTAGEFFHAPVLRANPDLRVTAIVTSQAGRAQRASQMFPSARVVDSPSALEPTALTVIATPHNSHIDLARSALATGSFVVVDKPLSADVETAETFARELNAAGCSDRVAVFHNRRWDSDFLTIRELLRQRRLGQVHRLESRIERWRPMPRSDSWRETANRGKGGGVLFDLGPHLVDQAVVLFGAVRSVFAEISSRRSGVTAGDDLFIALQHESGTTSHLSATALAADHAPRFRVRGSEGSFVTYGTDPQEAMLRSGGDPRDEGFGDVDPADWGVVHDASASTPVQSERGDWPGFYRGVVEAIKDEAPTPVAVSEAVYGLRVLAAAERSALQNRVVEITGKWEAGAR